MYACASTQTNAYTQKRLIRPKRSFRCSRSRIPEQWFYLIYTHEGTHTYNEAGMHACTNACTWAVSFDMWKANHSNATHKRIVHTQNTYALSTHMSVLAHKHKYIHTHTHAGATTLHTSPSRWPQGVFGTRWCSHVGNFDQYPSGQIVYSWGWARGAIQDTCARCVWLVFPEWWVLCTCVCVCVCVYASVRVRGGFSAE